MEYQYNSTTPTPEPFGSPFYVPILAGGRRSLSIFDPYASESSDSPSPLMKYLRAGDPANASSPSLFLTPVKVEEDVLVMDGIPVPKSNKGSSEGRTRSSLKSSDSGIGAYVGGRSSSTASSSSWRGSGGSGSDNSKFNPKVCSNWEVPGICSFGSKYQFAHVREEPRSSRLLGKNKLEISKPYLGSGGSSSSPYGTKSRPFNEAKATSSLPTLSIPTRMALPTPSIEVKPSSGTSNFICGTPIVNWSPLDDGIDVTLPFFTSEKEKPSKEDLDGYIQKVLYGTSSRKRLSAFEEFYPN